MAADPGGGGHQSTTLPPMRTPGRPRMARGRPGKKAQCGNRLIYCGLVVRARVAGVKPAEFTVTLIVPGTMVD